MPRKFIAGLALVFILVPLTALAMNEPGGSVERGEKFYRAAVVEILEEGQVEVEGTSQPFQKVQLKLLEGEESGKVLAIEQGKLEKLRDSQRVKKGERVVVVKVSTPEKNDYFIYDKYRYPSLGAILAVFFAAAVIFGGLRGLTSLLGLGLTVLVLVKYIVPQILAGRDPLVTTLIGSLVIIFLSMYLSHGFNRRTSVALAATLVSLALAAGLAAVFVSLARLFGTGSEEAFYVARGAAASIDFRGLLLAGIMIGVLGVLDDITTAQAAAVDEIVKANSALAFRDLYFRGISVGREHIASLVNTLVLAYAGASLPLFILLTTQGGQPLWVTLNGETLAEEIIRSLVGSTVLILAVPLTTMLAAYFLRGQRRTG